MLPPPLLKNVQDCLDTHNFDKFHPSHTGTCVNCQQYVGGGMIAIIVVACLLIIGSIVACCCCCCTCCPLAVYFTFTYHFAYLVSLKINMSLNKFF